MVADGLTKGSVDRTMLANAMHGSFELKHAVHEYQEPTATTTTSSVFGGVEGGGSVTAFNHHKPESSSCDA